jgi:hypothetical protein
MVSIDRSCLPYNSTIFKNNFLKDPGPLNFKKDFEWLNIIDK